MICRGERVSFSCVQSMIPKALVRSRRGFSVLVLVVGVGGCCGQTAAFSGDNKCSICAGKHVNSTNSLEILFPNIAAEWHPTKNGSLTAGDVTKKSKQEVWWLCKVGHEWQQEIGQRTGKKERPCQECKRQQNSVSKNFPKIAAEWHPTKNTDLEISNFTYGSNEIVWWLCANGHKWKDSIKKRCRNGGVMCQACKRSERKKKLTSLKI